MPIRASNRLRPMLHTASLPKNRNGQNKRLKKKIKKKKIVKHII